MTVAEFYERHAVNGRAVLDGTVATPTRWIVRLRGVGGVGFFVCGDEVTDHVRQVEGDADVEAVAGAPHIMPPPPTLRAVPGETRQTAMRHNLRASGRCTRCRRPWEGPTWKCRPCRREESQLRVAGGVQ